MISVPKVDLWNRWRAQYGGAVAYYDDGDSFVQDTGETLVSPYRYDGTAAVDGIITNTVADVSAPGGVGWANWTEIWALSADFPCIVQFIGATSITYGGWSAVYHPADQTAGRGLRLALEVDGVTIVDAYAESDGANAVNWGLLPTIGLSFSQQGYISIPVLVSTSIKLYGVRDGSFNGTNAWMRLGGIVKVAD